jgi:hypothetical protein
MILLPGRAEEGGGGGGSQGLQGRQGRDLQIKLSVGVTGHSYLLEIDGLFPQRWRSGRTFGDTVGGFLVMDSSDW